MEALDVGGDGAGHSPTQAATGAGPPLPPFTGTGMASRVKWRRPTWFKLIRFSIRHTSAPSVIRCTGYLGCPGGFGGPPSTAKSTPNARTPALTSHCAASFDRYGLSREKAWSFHFACAHPLQRTTR